MQNLVYWAHSKLKKKQTQGMENMLRAEPEQGWPGGAWLVSVHTSPGGSQSLEVSGPNFSICQVPQLGAAATDSSSTHEEGAGSGVAEPAGMRPPLTGLGKSWQMSRMGQELRIPNI